MKRNNKHIQYKKRRRIAVAYINDPIWKTLTSSQYHTRHLSFKESLIFGRFCLFDVKRPYKRITNKDVLYTEYKNYIDGKEDDNSKVLNKEENGLEENNLEQYKWLKKLLHDKGIRGNRKRTVHINRESIEKIIIK